jgi:hypothetical protein
VRIVNVAQALRRRVILVGLAASLLTLSLGVLAARADPPTTSSGQGMLILIDGCPGFVAAGGVTPNAGPPPPVPDSWTHNFLASWTQTAKWRFQNDPTGQKTVQVISFGAQGTDAGGQRFSISGKLTWHLFASTEQWADGGTVRIKRNDGAEVDGSAVGALLPALTPIFTVDRALEVTASSCTLR